MRTRSALAAGILYFSWSGNALAYLDPGTGFLILQGIIGAVAGVLVSGRIYFGKLKAGVTALTGFLRRT